MICISAYYFHCRIALFYPIPFMRWPIPMAKWLGDTVAQYRWFAFIYLIVRYEYSVLFL